ncbi:MAG TPA: TadE/TadG family type IV pilus assembly protein [Stellaceae bacterium]|nr:TadE/TadG family type IV pilus assembly protein [Stellaceae bacterium]
MRWPGLLTALRRGEDGVSAIEFAIIAPAVALLLLGVIDLADGLWEQMQVSSAAQAGAFYASVSGVNGTPSGIQSAVTNATGLSVTATLSSSASPSCQSTTPSSIPAAEWCGCPDTTSGVTSATCGSTCSDSSTAGHYVTVCAQAPFSAIGPAIPGVTLPTTLSAQSYARIYP